MPKSNTKSNTKTNKKPAKKAQRRRASRPRKNTPETRVQRLISALEERIDLDAGRSALEERVLKSYRQLVEQIQERTQSTRESAEAQLEELLERAQSSKAGEAYAELEDRFTSEVDEVLEKLGLMRVVRHEALVAKAEKRAVSRERSRRRREEKKAGAKKADAKAAEKD